MVVAVVVVVVVTVGELLLTVAKLVVISESLYQAMIPIPF